MAQGYQNVIAGEPAVDALRKKQSRTALLVPLVLIACLAFIANLNVLTAGFVWDDRALILGNPLIRSFENVSTFFRQPFLGMYYRPVVMVSFIFDYALWGLKPWGYHLTNLLLHSANTLMVFFLLLRLIQNKRIAFFAALLFAVHPVHKGVVAIADRTGILSASFFLLSVLLYVVFRQMAKSRSSFVLYLVSLFAGTLAFFSKEETLSLPLVLAMAEWLMLSKRPRLRLSDLAASAPFFLVAAFYISIRSLVLNSGTGLLSAFLIEPARRLITIPAVLVDYAQLLLLPLHLDYEPRTPLGFINEPRILFALLLCGFLVALGIKLGKRNAAAFGWFWYLVVFLPMSNLIPIYPETAHSHLFTPIHFLYLPSIGIFLCAAAGLDGLFRWRPQRSPCRLAAAAALCLILFLFSLLTMHRNEIWKDEERFYQYVLSMHPDNPRMRLNLGNVFLERGRVDEGLEQLKQAVSLAPDVAMYRTALALAYKDKGWLERALDELHQALEIDPRSVNAYINLASIYRSQGNTSQALSAAAKAVDISPSNAVARANYGLALMDTGDYPGAEEQFKTAVHLDSACVQAYIGLGVLSARQKRFDLAQLYWTQALRVQPDSLEARQNLQRLKQQRGEFR